MDASVRRGKLGTELEHVMFHKQEAVHVVLVVSAVAKECSSYQAPQVLQF